MIKANGEPRRKRRNHLWHEGRYVEVYKYAREGFSNGQISQAMDVDERTFALWRKKHPKLQEALDEGRADHNNVGQKMRGYYYERLPGKLQILWDKLEECKELPNGPDRLEVLLQEAGKSARQHLFIHVICSTTYNVNKAMKAVNISKRVLDNWFRTDPDFAEMLDEVQFIRKNWLESKLLDIVDRGKDPAITLAVNRAINADRGYNPKLELDVSGEIHHKHSVVSVKELDLPTPVLEELLEAGRQQQSLKTLEAKVV